MFKQAHFYLALSLVAIPNLEAQRLFNIDFGAHANPFFSIKTGKAAVGLSDSDFWNLYSRDGANGEYLSFSELLNLKLSDGIATDADLYVSGAPGAWYTFNPDPMFESYLYPGNPNINITLTNLPPAIFDVYVYAHGQPAAENSVIEIYSPLLFQGEKATSIAANWDSLGWVEGNQFVLFTNVGVGASGSLSITIKPGAAGVAVINGIQLLEVLPDSINSGITIEQQPKDISVPFGGSGTISVTAQSDLPLAYQWFFNGSALSNATSSSLSVSNVSDANAGNYNVVISNSERNVSSTAASIQVYTPVLQSLVNIDFGAHLNPFLRSKTGPAAVGKSNDDLWNLYSRDGEGGQFLDNNTLTNIVWSDGASSAIRLDVSNAGGAWNTLHPDPMFESYLYPLRREGQINAVFTSLPSGNYDVYVYAHGQIPSENAVVQLTTESSNFGLKVTSSSLDWNSHAWTEGNHYLHFKNVFISNGERLTVSSKPGQSGLAVLNGIQLLHRSTNPAPSITITRQPADLIVPTGSTADFSVLATNDIPLKYQWFFNNSPVAPGTNALLRLENVSSNDVGSYYVQVSAGADSVQSETARLQVFTQLEDPLLNIDYGAHLNPYLRAKSGPAAVGRNLSDQWNLYSRDGTNGAFLSSNQLSNLVWSDGQLSSISISVTNAAGAWYTLDPDPMFESYLYPLGRSGNIGSTLSNLPAGTYDIYVYAHGQIPGENGVIQLTTPSNNFGTRSTSHSPGWDVPSWTEGNHYVLFRNVILLESEPLQIVAKPGSSGLAVINGVQIIKRAFSTGTEISIQQHPQDRTLPTDSTAEFSVAATSALPLQFQWYHNGTNLPGATSSILRIENLRHSDAGNYFVVVSNAETAITSASARLDVYTQVDVPLLNIDFGSHQNPFLHFKTGPAAIGKNTDDQWNLYSRDDGQGGWRANGELSNLLWSDGSNSAIRLAVENAAGAWYTFNSDPMFESYLYPLSRIGNIRAEISRLPAGRYDLLVYAHGQIPSENGIIEVSTESVSYGSQSTATSQGWDPGFWVEGGQFVRFTNVIVGEGETLEINSLPGQSQLAVINGLQLILREGNQTEFSPVVADWTFEEAAVGTQVLSALDSSPNALHITQVVGGGGVFIPTDESTAGAISVSLPSVAGGIGNALRAPDSLEFNLGQQFTLEASLTPGTDNATWNRGVLVGQDAASGRLVYALDYRSEHRTLNFVVVGTQGETDFVTVTLPDDGRSHHVAGVYNSGTLKIYLDHALVATKSTTVVPGLTPGGAGRVSLGANDIGGYWFQGILDRVRISREALAPEDFFQQLRDPSSPVTILQPLQNQSAAAGDTATFQVIATGPGALAYQWFFNGESLVNQSSNTLVLSNVQSTHSGTYKVTVTSGLWEASSSATLTVTNAILTAPVILQQPSPRIGFVGGGVQLSVIASGSAPLAYQWKFNDEIIEGATASTLGLTNLGFTNAGFYSVRVSNDLGFTNSAAALLSVLPADLVAPIITITSPAPGSTSSNRVALAGTVSDNQSISHVEWIRNGQVIGPVTLVNGAFNIPDLLLATGTNTFAVRAFDLAGNSATSSVQVTLQMQRSISVGAAAAAQEGARLSFPIQVSSSGEIGALSFSIRYDTNYLAEPFLNWQGLQPGAFSQVNSNIAGVIHATYVLPGSTIPSGDNRVLANVRFRARSVPENITVPIHLDLHGVYSADGNPITSGTTVNSGEVQITRRKFIGDNNANDRLDIGDATAIIRMLTLLDPTRAWDVTGNDLNNNTSLDAGDIVRVLRAVVNLDPQPSLGAGLLARASLQSSAMPGASLSADRIRLTPGQPLRLKVSLAGLTVPLSGVSFRLEYPADALFLENSTAHLAGTSVPNNALALWNIAPNQDYSAQSGTLHFAASSATSWPSNGGEIADLNFTVRDSALTQYAWPVQLHAEVASGMDVVTLATAHLTLTGRDPAPAQLDELKFNAAGDALELRLVGEAGVRYRIETSADLVEWVELLSTSDISGVIQVSDPVDPLASRKFYRAIQLD
jgi:hypothetical protein